MDNESSSMFITDTSVLQPTKKEYTKRKTSSHKQKSQPAAELQSVEKPLQSFHNNSSNSNANSFQINWNNKQPKTVDEDLYLVLIHNYFI